MTGVRGPDGPESHGTEQIYSGRIVRLEVDTVRFADGSHGTVEVVRHSGAAAVLPLLGDPSDADPVVVLIRQWRHPVGDYLLEVPAGRPRQTGEPWEEVARRELEEETGYRSGELRPLTEIVTAPGFTDERIRVFLAWKLTPGERNPDPDEYLETVPLPLSAALALVRSGEIIDAKTICALLLGAAALQEHNLH